MPRSMKHSMWVAPAAPGRDVEENEERDRPTSEIVSDALKEKADPQKQREVMFGTASEQGLIDRISEIAKEGERSILEESGSTGVFVDLIA